MLVGKEISMRARVGAPRKVGGGQAQIVKFSETGYPKSVVEVCRHADGGGQQLPAPRAPVMCAQPRLRVPARVGTLILRAGAVRAVLRGARHSAAPMAGPVARSEEHTSELQSRF